MGGIYDLDEKAFETLKSQEKLDSFEIEEQTESGKRFFTIKALHPRPPVL